MGTPTMSAQIPQWPGKVRAEHTDRLLLGLKAP